MSDEAAAEFRWSALSRRPRDSLAGWRRRHWLAELSDLPASGGCAGQERPGPGDRTWPYAGARQHWLCDRTAHDAAVRHRSWPPPGDRRARRAGDRTHPAAAADRHGPGDADLSRR